MSFPHSVAASLCISGDTLDPTEISLLLGCQPTKSALKDEIVVGKVTGNKYHSKTGRWNLRGGFRENGNLNSQISELLSQLSEDSGTWKYITDRFRAEIFCGVMLASGNDMFGVSTTTLNLLSERNLRLEFDIYDAVEE